MTHKNEHPGTFRDSPEPRVLHITVDLSPEDNADQAEDHKAILDGAIQQTMLDTGYETTTESLSSQLLSETAAYEARILGHGSEAYFHALGGACMKMVAQAGIVSSARLNARWRINSAQSMQRPLVIE